MHILPMAPHCPQSVGCKKQNMSKVALFGGFSGGGCGDGRHHRWQTEQSLVLTAVATYPSARGWHGTHEWAFQGWKTRGVATNVYLRKTSEKPEKTWSTNFIVKGSGVVFTHGEGISTPRVRHKRQQPLIKCANMTSIFMFPFMSLFLFVLFILFIFLRSTRGFPLLLHIP